MSAAKILGGFIFLTIGILLLVIAFVPIPGIGLDSVCFTTLLLNYIGTLMAGISALNLSTIIGASGYLYIAVIIPLVGYHYCRAGIKSMRYDKAKKTYYISETKIGWMIVGFIIVCIAAVYLLLIFLNFVDPTLEIFENLWLLSPLNSYPGLLPQALVPALLTVLLIFFIYFIGAKIMKSGVKKEEMF
ncbi:MAG: hypothetical protein ACTSRS_11725 [Candidatus Helarchaeota archaeon]